MRYQSLFGTAADGSLARRFPVLLLILGIVVCMVVLLRRDKIAGAALGPSQRLIGSSVIAFAVLALTPTKWTHHFGAFAALGAGIAALTALATSSDVLRSRRNRLLFLAALFAILALAFTGPNTWWYTNNWGVPFNGGPPFWDGWPFAYGLVEPWPVYSLCLAVSVILLAAAGIEHVRGVAAARRRTRTPSPRPPRPPSARCWPRRRTRSTSCGRPAAGRASSGAPGPCASARRRSRWCAPGSSCSRWSR